MIILQLHNAFSIFIIFILAKNLNINNIIKNPKYKNEFTEKNTLTSIKHPGNAWSSIIYAFIGLYLLNTSSSIRPYSRCVEGSLLIWFAWLSFTYHSTENDWIGALDITLVIHLCISCLTHSLGLADINCILMSWSILLYFLLNVYENKDEPSNSITVKYMMPIVTTLVIILMWFQVGFWMRFFTFGLGFLLKKIDRIGADKGIILGVINGTSLFHILTGIAMYMHYEVML